MGGEDPCHCNYSWERTFGEFLLGLVDIHCKHVNIMRMLNSNDDWFLCKMCKNGDYCVEIRGIASVFAKEFHYSRGTVRRKWVFIVAHEERDDSNKKD